MSAEHTRQPYNSESAQNNTTTDPLETFIQKKLDETMGRRRALLTIAAAALAPVLLRSDSLPSTEGDIPQDVTIPGTERKLLLGDEREVPLAKFGIQWTPDLHLPYVTIGERRRFFVSGNGGNTYVLEGHASDDIISAVASATTVDKAWGTESTHGKYGYSAIGSVLQIDPHNPNHLIAFTHNEEHAGNNPDSTFTASISQLESVDGGLDWQQVRNEPVIKGDDPLPPGTAASGAGQPSAIVIDGNVYVYYTNWTKLRADQVCVARARIGAHGRLGPMEFHKGHGNFAPGEQGIVPVIPIPNKKSRYTALPSISYNTALGKYLAITETDQGFDTTTSVDGIQWQTEQLFDQFQYPHSSVNINSIFVSYPTLLSFTQPSDSITDSSGYLVYAQGPEGGSHNMVVRPFSIA